MTWKRIALIWIIFLIIGCLFSGQAQPAEKELRTVRCPLILANRSPQSAIRLTPAERVLIERVVAAEARGESFKGQMAVAQVILDRIRWGMIGRTAAQVVTLPRQFADPYDGPVPDDTKAAVRAVFYDGVRVTREPIVYFAAPSIANRKALKWMRGFRKVATIGGHEFYSSEKGDR